MGSGVMRDVAIAAGLLVAGLWVMALVIVIKVLI